MTLSDFTSEIERAERLEIAPNPDGLEDTPAKAACWLLRELSRDIRRTLWTDRESAYALADRADQSAERIMAENNLMGPGRLPRFGELTSGGIYHPPIM